MQAKGMREESEEKMPWNLRFNVLTILHHLITAFNWRCAFTFLQCGRRYMAALRENARAICTGKLMQRWRNMFPRGISNVCLPVVIKIANDAFSISAVQAALFATNQPNVNGCIVGATMAIMYQATALCADDGKCVGCYPLGVTVNTHAGKFLLDFRLLVAVSAWLLHG